MNRRDYAILVSFIAAAFVTRWFFFDKVGVWGDFGFWTYDAQLIHRGETPFIDFLGRSPLSLYLYAGASALTGEYVHTLRWFATTWYVLTAVPIYLLAKDLGDRRVAVAALTFYLFTPFSIAYGMRASTQSMALFFTMWGIYAIYRSDSTAWIALGGLAIGLGFTARQSVVAVAGGVGLWLLWRDYRDRRSPQSVLARLSAFSAAWVGAVFLVYLLVMRDLSMAVELFNQQVIGLFITDGRGGYPLIGVDFPVQENKSMENRIPILHDIFPQLNDRGARVFASTIVAASPAFGMLFYYVRDWLQWLYSDRGLQYFGGVMLALAAYAVAASIWSGYYYRSVIIVGLVLIMYFAWRSPPLDRDLLYSRGAVLLLAVCFTLMAGYLFRDRLLANYYFLDFWPFVSILSGLLFVGVWQKITLSRRYALFGILGLLFVTSGAAAHPLANTMLDAENSESFTMDNLEGYQQDINERTEPGEVVFTGHPTYVAGTHAEMPMDDPRIHYRYSAWAHEEGMQWPASKMFYHIKPRLEGGEYEYMILDTMTARILYYALENDIINPAFLDQYCRVAEVDELYEETGAALYQHQPNKCVTERPDKQAIDQESEFRK